MAIRKPKAMRVSASNSLHYPNETTEKPELSGQDVLNHQEPETLVDPEDKTSGSTHFRNDEKKMPANNPRVSASAKNGKKQVKAAPSILDEDLDGEDDEIDADADFDFDPEEDAELQVEANDEGGTTGEAGGQQNLSTIDNQVDPATGYLPEGGELNGNADDDIGGEIPEGYGDDDTEVVPGDNPQQALETGANDEWDEGDMTLDPDEDVVVDTPLIDESVVDEDAIEDAEDTDGDALNADAGDAMDVVDIDGMDDDASDVAFATTASKVLVLRKDRVIAKMTRTMAAAQDKADVYLTDQFQEVTASEMKRQGLRRGLKHMGFAMAKVNVAKSDVLNKRVQAKVAVQASAQRQVMQKKTADLEQAMAIAAVGINKSYFKDVQNPLRAAFEQELSAAGVRNASKLVRRVLAQAGLDYAHAIVSLAQKLAEMPETARNVHAENLDLVSDEVEDDDLFGAPASDDFQEVTADEDGFGEDDAYYDDAPNSVTAALLRPARTKVRASVGTTSVTAAAILNGEAPLTFGI